MSSCPYNIGDTVRFKPCANVDKSAGFGEVLGVMVTGTVVQTHEEHRWYRAVYKIPTGTLYECFKY
ncbi:MAG: hypothetical protein Q4E45_02340 [Eubacteriales bacterium]|nr:hypothetical protein [Eubacteriales bacterium]